MSALAGASSPAAGAWAKLWRDPRYVSLGVTIALFLGMTVAGGVLYDGFLRPQVFLNLLIDNAFLLIVAVGMTFVILSGGIDLSVGAVVAFSTVLLAALVQKHGWHPLAAIPLVLALGTGFGALMGTLMGLPVDSTRVRVYALSGFCAALAGVVYTFYMLSGYSLHATGLELDAIAAVVIGGTLLAGGSGYVLGTLFGVLVLGLIQTLIVFDGTLSSWWTKIAIGGLLLAFCLLQRLLSRRSGG